jgi:hypothetical protein
VGVALLQLVEEGIGVVQLVGVGEYVLVGRAEAKLTAARATVEVEKRMVRGEVRFVLGRLCK